ncbi:MAG: aromatic acid exporter family protein [Christensenellaceae bacterium]
MNHFTIPLPGMRTVKTAICVFICLVLNIFIGNEFSLYSSIAAIVCMQSTIETTISSGINRLIGTIIGGLLGMLMIFFLQFSLQNYLYLVLMPIGIIAVIYTCNLIKKPGSATIGAIVFLIVFGAPTTLSSPYTLAISRILFTIVGIVIAVLVNRFIVPAKRFEDKKLHLSCDTFQSIYLRVKDRLVGNETLILYASSLTDCHTEYKPAKTPCTLSVRIPVPMEHTKNQSFVHCSYISAEYTVTPMKIEVDADGYLEIPPETLPCTVVWQFQSPDEKNRIER